MARESGESAVKKQVALLRQGYDIGVYPEEDRQRQTVEPQPFHQGVFQPATQRATHAPYGRDTTSILRQGQDEAIPHTAATNMHTSRTASRQLATAVS